jgi:hypothetical protein
MADTSPTERDRTSDRLRPANPVSPAVMAAKERLAEIAEILAAGLQRLRARKSSQKSREFGESSLDITGHQSGPADPKSPESAA